MRTHPIAIYRRVQGLSQVQLAAQIGVSWQAVQKWEQRGYAPRGETFQRLAQVLGVAPAQLAREIADWRQEKRRLEESSGKVEAA